MNSSTYRKIAYLAAFVALLFPMAYLGAPSTREEEGGKLARLRSEAKLGQADLGAIDPASETIRMATLGLRGMAVTMLWNKANHFKKVEDWTSFRATLEQLARLQPYFVKVWQYQAWNLSYNVSVELDDVRDRFYYVKQGIQYLKEGIQFLRDNPTLLEDLGWFCGNKVGRADEHREYRRMFKADDDLHDPDVELVNRDNWLVSRQWYETAIAAVDDRKQPLGTKNPVTFFDSPARSQMSYAEAIQDEGILRTRWLAAWAEGARLWREYGNRDMPSTEGFRIRLADQEKLEAEIAEMTEQLEAMAPGLRGRLLAEAEASLTPQQKKLLGGLPAEPTAEELELQAQANDAMTITPAKLAARIAGDFPELAREARRLGARIEEHQSWVRSISTNRDVANFEFWRIRCDLEQTPEALEARYLAHQALAAFDRADRQTARQLYEESFDLWAQALAKFPDLPPDSTMGSDLMDFVEQYVKVLAQLDLSLEDEDVANRFALWSIVENNNNEGKYSTAIQARQERRTGVPTGTQPLINPADGLIP